MAKLPPKKSEDGGGDWLNTYADMVTLLLTFFVLLFACSNLDETKLQYVFQEFKSRGKYVNQFLEKQDPTAVQEAGGTTDNSHEVGGEGTMPESFEELYVYLAEYIDNNNLADSVSIENGASHFIFRFDSAVMFDGDSAYLKDEGREVLDKFIPAIRAVQNSIAKDTVTGHTAVGNSIVNDWSLSSQRAVAVTNYLISQKAHAESKFRISACGPYEPLDPDDPAKNRRVELVMLKNELDLTDPEVIKDILKHDFAIDSDSFDPNNQQQDDPSKLPPGSVDKIISFIKEKFDGDDVTNIGKYGPGAVNGDKFIVTEETSGGDTSS